MIAQVKLTSRVIKTATNIQKKNITNGVCGRIAMACRTLQSS